MRKITHIKVLGLTLFAVLAFSAVAAATAFAEDEWLVEGLTFTGELATNTEGTLTLAILTLTGVRLNQINCSGLLEGTVTGLGPVGLVLDLFSLTNALIEELSGTSLACETLVDEGGCRLSSETGSEMLLWVDELRLGTEPLTWESLIELMTTGPVFLLHLHHVAFELLCLTLAGADLESLCEGLTSGALTNVAPNVLLEFGEGNIESEALTCLNTVGEVEAQQTLADLSGDLLISHAGGTLAVS